MQLQTNIDETNTECTWKSLNIMVIFIILLSNLDYNNNNN